MHPKLVSSQDNNTWVEIYNSGDAPFLFIFIRLLNISTAANAHPLLHGAG
jgi:hypothetical protein